MEKNEQFEYWLEVREKCMIGLEGYCAINIYVIEHFNQLPPAFQWGVYLEFFDSVGIIIDVNPTGRTDEWFNLINQLDGETNFNVFESPDYLESRQEAQTEAIKRLLKY